MTTSPFHTALNELNKIAQAKRYGWLNLVTSAVIRYCLSCMTPEDTKDFVNDIIDKEVKKGGL